MTVSSNLAYQTPLIKLITKYKYTHFQKIIAKELDKRLLLRLLTKLLLYQLPGELIEKEKKDISLLEGKTKSVVN